MNAPAARSLAPTLVVRDAARAGDFYATALGATVLARYAGREGRAVVHVDLALGAFVVSVAQEAPAWGFRAPPSIGGTPVVLTLGVEDVERAVERMHAAGAALLVSPLDFCGERMARLRDPFGHEWIVSQLSPEEIQRRRDAWVPPQGAGERSLTLFDAPRPAQDRPSVHLLVGPVGAGKSTLARVLARRHRAPWLDLDEWMVPLFRPDRPADGVPAWYAERAARCVQQMCALADRGLSAGTSVVLEAGLLRRDERARFFGWVDARGHGLTVHALDAPRDVRRVRVARRNPEKGETFRMEVPAAVFELASDLWEPLTEEERRGRDVREQLTSG